MKIADFVQFRSIPTGHSTMRIIKFGNGWRVCVLFTRRRQRYIWVRRYQTGVRMLLGRAFVAVLKP